MLLCNLSFLKSRYLYCKRKSSFTFEISIFSEFISNGSTFLHFPSISILLASISISPVGIFVFLLERSSTFPVTLITVSSGISSICFFKFSSLITIWVMPYWSLKSTNCIEPKFLILWTHPASITISFTFLIFSSPQLWSLYIICSFLITINFRNFIFL